MKVKEVADGNLLYNLLIDFFNKILYNYYIIKKILKKGKQE